MKKYVYIFNGFKYYIFSIPSTIDSYTMQWCIHIIPKVYLPQGAYHQGRQLQQLQYDYHLHIILEEANFAPCELLRQDSLLEDPFFVQMSPSFG